ncbi:MAG: OmpA family protein [Gammaproteobacteria bacterium]|jgi:outer membrane protein OmpA-like peptidoglycan-associated protein
MNRRKERFVETFVTVMFPVALLVACTTNGNETSGNDQTPTVEYTQPAQQAGPVETSALPFGSTLSTQPAPGNEDLSWDFDQKDNNYAVVPPSLHLAIYKPTQRDAGNVATDESVQMVKYNEPQDLASLDQYTFHFATDDYDLDDKSLAALKAHADFLNNHPNFTLTISGHTDRSGSKAYNQKLSEQRAQLVAEILITYGVSQSQLIVDGYGETVPESDKPEENRRVELEYSQTLLVSSR